MPCSLPPSSGGSQNEPRPESLPLRGPEPQVQIDLAEQIWMGLEVETRQAILYLTKQEYAAGGFLPGYAMDEHLLVHLILLCQELLRELRTLPLQPRLYP